MARPLHSSRHDGENINQKNRKNQTIFSRMKQVSGKISMILGIVVASHVTTPVVRATEPHISESKSIVSKISSGSTPPPKAKIETTKQSIDDTLLIAMGPRPTAIAVKGESVESFMLKNFDMKGGWQRLVDTKSGHRVRNPNRDLIANRTYILAENEQETIIFSDIYKKKAIEVREVKKLQGQPLEKIKKSRTLSKKKHQSKGSELLKGIEDFGFNYAIYCGSIAAKESNHRYDANNAEKGRKLGVNSSKWAMGKYQFTHKTLGAYGITTPKDREDFLRSPRKQENIMRRYTLENIAYILDNSEKFKPLMKAGVHPYQILSAMHHMGAYGVGKIAKLAIETSDPVVEFFDQLRQHDDWLHTSTYKYVKLVSERYKYLAEQKFIAENKKSEDFSPLEKVPTIVRFKPKETRENMGDPDISNEERSTVNIISSVPAVQVNAILERVSRDTETKISVREPLIAKLEETNDLVALYQNNIEHYELRAYTGSREAKEMLPKLRSLLTSARAEQMDLRASVEESIMHYEIEVRKGSLDAKKILKKLYKLVEDDNTSVAQELAA